MAKYACMAKACPRETNVDEAAAATMSLTAVTARAAWASAPLRLPRRFFRATAQPIGQAWRLAVGGELSLPEVDGTPPLATRLLNGYLDRVLIAAEYDTTVFEQFVKVAWLVDSPTRLLRFSMIRRAAAAHHGKRRRGQHIDTATPARLTGAVQRGWR
jgi:hypothetical protein